MGLISTCFKYNFNYGVGGIVIRVFFGYIPELYISIAESTV